MIDSVTHTPAFHCNRLIPQLLAPHRGHLRSPLWGFTVGLFAYIQARGPQPAPYRNMWVDQCLSRLKETPYVFFTGLPSVEHEPEVSLEKRRPNS